MMFTSPAPGNPPAVRQDQVDRERRGPGGTAAGSVAARPVTGPLPVEVMSLGRVRTLIQPCRGAEVYPPATAALTRTASGKRCDPDRLLAHRDWLLEEELCGSR